VSATAEGVPPRDRSAAPETSGEILAVLRTLRGRARMRPGLTEDAVETMRALGFEVARCVDADALVARVLQIIPPGAEVVYHPCAVGRAVHLDDALRREGRRVVVLPDDAEPYRQNGAWREHILAAQFGITGANAVVADTGSLALAEDLGFGRAASNVPPVHIALVTADSIVENLLDAAEVARAYAVLCLGRPVPRYLSFITGPSRTADIGLQLVRGMHGPRIAHVLIWDRPKADGLDDAALRAWVLA
jgi:LUD domain